MANPNKFPIPEEFKPIHSMMGAQLLAQGAPQNVRDAWRGFVEAVSEWKCPQPQGGDDVKEGKKE